MANEKVIQTRLSLKIDTYANWTLSNATTQQKKTNADFVLNHGEIGLCEIKGNDPIQVVDPNNLSKTQILFKVGDGVTPFKNLNWASALAADVYAWAKQSENDFVKNFLALKMTDGTTMQAKLDGVFATDAELSAAIAELRDEIPTQLGVMSISSEGDGVVTITKNTKAAGDVTLNVAHAKKGPTNGYTGGQTATTAQVGKEMTIKVPKLTVDAYGHTTTASDVDYKITIPQNVDTWRPVAVNGKRHLQKTEDTTLEIDGGSNIEVEWDEEDGAVVISHGAKPTTGTAHTAAEGEGRTYITKVDVDDYGHIAKVYTATETVVDTNTAHTHSVGDGLKQTGEGRTDGNVLTELNLAFVDDSANKLLKLVDAKDNTKVIASFDTTDFIKDSFLKGATYDANTNTLTLQFLDNDDNTEDIEVDLSGLVDVYTADEKTLTKTTGTDGSAQFKIKAGGVGAGEIDTAIKQEIAKGVSAYGWGSHANAGYLKGADIAGKADKVSGATAGNFAALDANGNLTDSGKKAADFQPAGNYKTKQDALDNKIDKPAHVLSSLSQNANGEISYEVKELTPGDIGAAPAPVEGKEYLLNDGYNAANDFAIMAETIKFTTTDNNPLEVSATEILLDQKPVVVANTEEVYIFNCGTATTVI